MEVIATICLFSLAGALCFLVLTVLFIVIDIIFEDCFVGDFCEKAVKACALITIIGTLIMVVLGTILVASRFICALPLEVSE